MTSVIDTYELSPMQAGMLFHTVSGEDPGVDISQAVATLHEPLDEAHFLRAWQRVAERHPILRSRFRWEGVPEPVQDVIDRVQIPVERFDWRALAETERRERFQALLDRDRARGFDLGQAPLMRLALVRAAEREHWVLWTNHHAVLDGRARLLVLREVFAFHEAFSRGGDLDVPLPRPYRDYIEWLRTLDHDAAKPYWQGALSGFRAPTPLGVARDHEAEHVAGGAWGAYEARLSTILTTALRERAREASVTLNNLLQGAWALLLHRYSGESDIVFGATRACRRSALGGADDMVGLFINTLPIRVSIDPQSELVPWLQQMRAQQMSLRDYEHTPLVKVQSWSAVPRGSPLFESILVFENQTLDARLRALGGAWSEHRFLIRGQASFPLALNAWGDDELMLRLEYSRRRFADNVVARMLGHLQTLLEGMAAQPQARLKDLPVLTEAERQQANSRWNGAASYPKGACLHQRFEERVELTPEAVALVYEGQRLSYADLNRRANQLAHRLRDLGVTPDQLVGLRTDRSVEMVIGIIGILKSGGAYLPLDPVYPKDRITFMLEDSRVAVVVTQESMAADLEGIAVTRVLLDGPLPGADTNPASVTTADHLAYVIYTSGSTGKPKGALITHYNVTRLFEATDHWYHFDHQDVWTLFHSYAFDFSVWELWGALLYGGRVVIVPYWVSRSPEAFRELLVRERVTVLNQTPSAFRQLIQAELSEPKAELALRYVIFGGEALELQSLQSWFERYGDTRPLLVNMYGITETTVHVTYRPIRREDLESGQGSVIGEPIPDLQIYILDSNGQPVPIGVAGEIYVGGAGVARGYLNRAELTAQRFIPDPFRSTPEAKLYRTGDLARRLENGDIEYLGRIDHQVKIRGFRIELGEIEAGIARHAAIREVVVLAREDAPGDKRLVAYLVAENPPADLVGELRALIRADMPEYMVPAHFVTLDVLPLTPTGKVDRKALPAPERSASQQVAYVPPRTATEEILAGAWAEVLGVERVGVEDNFFELGGHSLLAMQVVSRVRQALCVELPLRDLFAASTVSRLGSRIEALRTEARPVLTVPALEATAEAGPAKLSFSQQRLWVLDQIEPGGAAYIIAGALELRGALDAPVLERALEALVHRHESLRTVFESAKGRPLQVVSEPGAWTLPVADLSGEVDARERLRTLLREEASRGFDLARGPLFRARLYRLAADTHVLLLAMHHIISDGWSLGILNRELGELYGRFRRGEAAALPVLRLQYLDFARWQRSWLEGEALEGLLSHWRSRLDGAPQVLELPADRPRPPVQSQRGASYSFRLPLELAQALRGLARREGATLFMTLLSGFTLLLSRYSGQQDLLVGTPVANRSHAEIEDMVGFFVNTLVLRADLSGDLSASQFLARMREVCLDAYAHQDLPFERLVEEMQPQRDLSRNPLFQAMFALQNAPLRPLELPGLTLRPVEVERGTAQFDLTLQMQETAEGLSGSFEYATDLFDEPTIARMATHLRLLLEGMSATPERCVWELPLLTEAERHQLLVEWNDTATDYPPARCVHEMVEEQAQIRPDALAAESGGRQLTYRELNERAERLAEQLRIRGVQSNSLVAIYLERSLEMLVGLLGVWKAGGAYVPIDPEYPAERVRFMLEDTKSVVVLTQKSLSGALPASDAAILLLDAEEDRVAGSSRRRPKRSPMSPEQLAYVIYTSGSTGRPKGVPIKHGSLFNLICWHQQAYEVRPADRATQIAGPAFDASVWEIWPYLTAGASVHIPDDSTRLDAGLLVRWLAERQITLTFLPTPLAEAALRESWPQAAALRVLLTGGDKLNQRPTQKLPFRLVDHYGPTENTVVATCIEVQAKVTSNVAPPIGRPLPNTQAYVLDRHLQPMPIGVPGELLVGGVQLTSGYWNRPDLSAEQFISDPFHTEPGARLYKTGDLVRLLADGNIEFLGRIDNQVKLRGFRIELEEIEAVLAEHPGVRQAAVHLWTVKADDARIVACCVPAKAGVLAPISLRKYLRARLPEYMVPQYFLPVDEIPLTPNGKVDRRRLPTPVVAESRIGRHEAPSDPIEATIAEIWTQLIHPARPIGRIDKFFEMGGHSLLGINALRQIEDKLGVRLEFRVLFQESLADIATRCRSERIAG